MSLGDTLGSLGGFYGGIIGDWMTKEERARQLEQIERQRRLYQSLPVELQAELERFYELEPSAYEQLREDPLLRGEQLRSLEGLREVADTGGMDAQSRAALAEAQAASAGQERAQRGAILDQFARMGGGGGNQALLAALTSQQGAASRAGMEGLRAAGDASARRYRALADVAGLAGDVRGADYRAASDKASAMDRRAAFNAAQRQAVAGRNTDRTNTTAENNRAKEYERARMVGGTYGSERDYWAAQERRKRGLWAGGGEQVGRNIGTGMDLYGGGGP